MATANPLQPRGGLLDMMGQGDSAFAGWLDPRRNAIINFGTGLIGADSARDAMRGAAQGLQTGRQQDTAYALLQQEQAEKQQALQEQAQQRNATLEYLQQAHPDLAQAVQGGLSVGDAWGEAIRRSQPAAPDYGFTFAPDGTLIRTDTTSGTITPMGGFRDPSDAPTVTTLTRQDGSEVAAQWDGATQTWVPINAPGGGGQLPVQGDLTEAEQRYTLFQSMQTETQPVLLDLENQFNPANIEDAVARSTPIAGNFFQSEQGQIYTAAARAWAEGALRIATGAAATPEEMERTIATYFAQPGDTPNTIMFKAAMREMYNRSLNRALSQPTGDGKLPLPSEFASQMSLGGPRTTSTGVTWSM